MRPLASALFLAASLVAPAQTPLHQRLATLAKEAQGHVYVACSLPGTTLDCDLDPHGHPPMQSTFKFSLALAILHQVELGKLSLEQPVRFLKSDRYPGTYSSLQEEFPEADVRCPCSANSSASPSRSPTTPRPTSCSASSAAHRPCSGILNRSASAASRCRTPSVACTTASPHSIATTQSLPATVALLRLFADRSPLNAEHTKLLNGWMLATPSGPGRIKGLLPAGTPVAHKTGSSGTQHGFIPATNDIGLITLPDGRRLALAVYVIDAHASVDACEHTIATIARAIYDAALATR